VRDKKGREGREQDMLGHDRPEAEIVASGHVDEEGDARGIKPEKEKRVRHVGHNRRKGEQSLNRI